MALYVVFKERQQNLIFLGRKNKVQMIFEVSEKNEPLKVLDILFNENTNHIYVSM